MAKLEQSIEAMIYDLRKRSGEALRAKKMEESIAFGLKAWDALPDPKFIFDESFQIANGMIFIYMQMNDLINAEKWSEILYDCNKERFDDGHREFISGKIAFEMNKKEKALEFFKIANEKSRGRCFEGADKKYKSFFMKG